jgi:predicted transcriptional regulator
VEKGEKIDETKVREGIYNLLAMLFQVLSSPTRIQILDLLRNNPPAKSFSDIMFTINKNPNVVNHHLRKLQDFGLIKKAAAGHYKITEIGDLALSATSENILQIVENALDFAKKSDAVSVT